jgi:hypothetical protein
MQAPPASSGSAASAPMTDGKAPKTSGAAAGSGSGR